MLAARGESAGRDGGGGRAGDEPERCIANVQPPPHKGAAANRWCFDRAQAG
jgi:hypothetical protein